jgi:hypothetical protein
VRRKSICRLRPVVLRAVSLGRPRSASTRESGDPRTRARHQSGPDAFTLDRGKRGPPTSSDVAGCTRSPYFERTSDFKPKSGRFPAAGSGGFPTLNQVRDVASPPAPDSSGGDTPCGPFVTSSSPASPVQDLRSHRSERAARPTSTRRPAGWQRGWRRRMAWSLLPDHSRRAVAGAQKPL